MTTKMVSVRDYERKKPIFPRIFVEPRMPETVLRISLTKRDEERCFGFTKTAVRDAMDSILRDRSKDDSAEIADIVRNRMINCLLRLDHQKLANTPKLGKDQQNDQD